MNGYQLPENVRAALAALLEDVTVPGVTLHVYGRATPQPTGYPAIILGPPSIRRREVLARELDPIPYDTWLLDFSLEVVVLLGPATAEAAQDTGLQVLGAIIDAIDADQQLVDAGATAQVTDCVLTRAEPGVDIPPQDDTSQRPATFRYDATVQVAVSQPT